MAFFDLLKKKKEPLPEAEETGVPDELERIRNELRSEREARRLPPPEDVPKEEIGEPAFPREKKRGREAKPEDFPPMEEYTSPAPRGAIPRHDIETGEISEIPRHPERQPREPPRIHIDTDRLDLILSRLETIDARLKLIEEKLKRF